MKQQKDFDAEQIILETAEKLFLEKGFAATSTVEIAKEAGYNQALVHYYFRTKEKLFQRVFEKNAKIFLSAFYKNIEAEGSFEEKITKVIEGHFDILTAHPKLPFFFINELSTNPGRLLAVFEAEMNPANSVIPRLTQALDQEIKNGNIRPLNAVDILFSIISLNAMSFIAVPFFETVFKFSEEESKKILKKRKKENVWMILQSLKP